MIPLYSVSKMRSGKQSKKEYGNERTNTPRNYHIYAIYVAPGCGKCITKEAETQKISYNRPMKAWKIIFWIVIAIVLIFGVVTSITTNLFEAQADPGTNIHSDPAERVAWSDISGYWDFYISNTVTVFGSKIEGYAESAIGDISLDCATTRNGNICTSSNYGICNGPGPHNIDGTCTNGNASGILSGYAWNDAIGWVSFNCNQTNHGGPDVCISNPYGVTINGVSGDFEGFAWNDIEGWIGFHGSSTKVATTWRATSSIAYLESSIFDTGEEGGVVLNSIIWQGTQPSGTSVDFQIAVSNSPTGPWTFIGPGGSEFTYYGASCPAAATSFPGAGADTPICIDKLQSASSRYLRYKVRLISNLSRTESPEINDIVLNWSR
ncbi:hypothetical protein CL629_01015 [bacterium]|nr:hypothetical protein [bacterium]